MKLEMILFVAQAEMFYEYDTHDFYQNQIENHGENREKTRWLQLGKS